MTNKANKKEFSSRQRLLILKLTTNSLKIIFRFLKLLFNGQKMESISFQPDSEYCIDGTINQLRWEIRNAVFITVSNSSQLFFNSGQLLFKVKKGQKEFQLTAYGVGKKTKLFTKIKVVALNKKDFSKIETISKNIDVNIKKVDLSKQIKNCTISFQNRKPPIPFKQIELKSNQSDFLQNTLTKISSVSSKEELEDLKLLLK
tara:strand:- start:3312 stop:3917 length:606 start_codon:yes stop_codon:yes gene_type:complete